MPLKHTQVARAKPVSAAPPKTTHLDAGALDLFFKLANNHGRLRARLDGVEARVQLLESLLDRRGGR